MVAVVVQEVIVGVAVVTLRGVLDKEAIEENNVCEVR
jgi:hypothetical protein